MARIHTFAIVTVATQTNTVPRRSTSANLILVCTASASTSLDHTHAPVMMDTKVCNVTKKSTSADRIRALVVVSASMSTCLTRALAWMATQGQTALRD